MKTSTLLGLGVALLLAARAQAQLDVPVSHVALANPSAPPMWIDLGGSDRYILPTPFVLTGNSLLDRSALWICMDPLQEIFYQWSGEPAGSFLHYPSSNPADYDKWNPSAPGLNAQRIQDLADLFYAYAPTHTNGLVASALQLAVPEITNEFDGNPLSLSSGQFRAWGSGASANAIASLAQTMLDNLNSPAVKNHGDVKSLHFLIDGTYTNRNGTVPVQDLVGFIPVPEPATYGFVGLALIGPLVAFRLLRRRSASGAK